MKNDEYYMSIALKEAQKAFLRDEVPVGAVIVDEKGKVIAKAFNQKEKLLDPTAHAEIMAIKKACKKRQSYRLVDCTLFVTIEPCSMCAGTISWARIKRVVFGAKDEKGGALGSSYDLFSVKGINHKPKVQGGILEEECGKIIKDYFKGKR